MVLLVDVNWATFWKGKISRFKGLSPPAALQPWPNLTPTVLDKIEEMCSRERRVVNIINVWLQRSRRHLNAKIASVADYNAGKVIYDASVNTATYDAWIIIMILFVITMLKRL